MNRKFAAQNGSISEEVLDEAKKIFITKQIELSQTAKTKTIGLNVLEQ